MRILAKVVVDQPVDPCKGALDLDDGRVTAARCWTAVQACRGPIAQSDACMAATCRNWPAGLAIWRTAA